MMLTFVLLAFRSLMRLFGDVRRNVVPEPYPSDQAPAAQSFADDMV